MKFPLTLALGILLAVPACSNNAPRSTQAAPEQRTNSTDQMKNERDQYVDSMQARLSEFDKRFDGLDERAGAMKGTEESNFKHRIDQLRDQRKDVAKKLDDLKAVSVESWTTMKGEVDSAMAGLEHAYAHVSDTNLAPETR